MNRNTIATATKPEITGGRLLRTAREQLGLSQSQLAVRAGTRQSAISRIETDRVSPSVDTLRELLRLMGEDLVLATKPREFGVDVSLNEANLEYTPSQRVVRGLAFSDVVGEVQGEDPAGGGLSAMMNADLGPSLQPASLLGALDRNAVDFVVIGGVAGLAHGSSYPTFDLDIAYARDRRNLERLAAALVELEVTLRNAPADPPFQRDADSLEAGANLTFESKFGRFDILGRVDGVRSYEWLRSGARIQEVSGFSVRVASLDQLIGMKRSVNRTKDQLMVEEYIVIAGLDRRKDEQREADG